MFDELGFSVVWRARNEEGETLFDRQILIKAFEASGGPTANSLAAVDVNIQGFVLGSVYGRGMRFWWNLWNHKSREVKKAHGRFPMSLFWDGTLVVLTRQNGKFSAIADGIGAAFESESFPKFRSFPLPKMMSSTPFPMYCVTM